MKHWISAFRLRTLPLALSSIGMGGFLAASVGKFNFPIFFLCCTTTVFLQILSNLANDLGDSMHGVDHGGRKGPLRTVQSGLISSTQMKIGVITFIFFSLLSGLLLLWFAFGNNWKGFVFFLLLGFSSIVAAIAYTVGKRPYGYIGLGDFSVLIFFGFVGVLGSVYVQTKEIHWQYIFPALSCGLFSAAVLNINNIRDIDSDKAAGKFSVPVRIGQQKAVIYQYFLLGSGIAAAIGYVLLNDNFGFTNFLFLAVVPILYKIGQAVGRLPVEKLDPWLKRMALTTLLFVILFGVGLIWKS